MTAGQLFAHARGLVRYAVWLPALLVAVLTPAAMAESGPRANENPLVVLETNHGNIVFELLAGDAPVSTANFLEYVRSGFYEGTIFHRVIPGFMIQGGGHTTDLERKQPRPSIQNEADNGLSNVRGAVAMARRNAPDSANSQFFVNVVDNPALDHRNKTAFGWGYAVFARVVEGMDVVDDIAASATTTTAGLADVPVVPVVIESARVLEPSP